MKRWRLSWIACALLTTGQVSAAEIRSGEHADFSRLVIQFDETSDWAFGRDGEDYVLRSDGLAAVLDTSRVFDLIPRDRIARIFHDRAAAEFRISLGCACHGDAFEIRAGRVVIDIKDGPAPETSPFEAPLPEELEVSQPEQIETTPTRNAESAVIDPDPQPQAEIATGVFREELVRGLSRAMTQGLVRSGISLDALLEPETPAEEPPDLPQQNAPAVVQELAPDDIGLNAMTQVEIDRLKRFLSDPSKKTQKCAKLDDLDLSLDESDPLARVRHDRAHLFDPMGRLSQTVAFDLSVAYLSLGFGAEALEILRLVDQSDPRTSAFQAIAAILEQQPIESENPFWGQIECRGGYVIWEVLSRNIASRLDDEHLRGIQLRFLELPKPLRRRIGPELGMKLADAGYVEVAQVIRNSLVRAESEAFPALRNLDASMEMETDNPVGAIRHLEELVMSQSDETPAALIRLFRAYASEEIVPSQEFLELLSSYSFELQGSETGRALALLEIEFFLRGNRVSQALEILERYETGEGPLTQSETVQFLRTLLLVENDVGFARALLNRQDFLLSAGIPDALFEALVERTIAAGFLEFADHVLENAAARPPETEARLARYREEKERRVLLALDGKMRPE